MGRVSTHELLNREEGMKLLAIVVTALPMRMSQPEEVDTNEILFRPTCQEL
jgi:hypothetical protein